MDLIKKIEFLVNYSLYQHIYVGFSGGADSTALLLILKELSKNYSFQLTAIHFEHGIRGEESLADARWCRNFSKCRNISYLEYNLNTFKNIKPSDSIEEAARRLRLEKWKEIAAGNSCAVALGHHAEDKLENLFIRLLRGSNSSGLTSLRYLNEVNGVVFLRPLLDITKSEILNYLEMHNITDWRNDLTNAYNNCRRNFLRNKLLRELFQTIPSAKKALINSYCAIEDDARFIESEAETIYRKWKRKKYISLYKDLLPTPTPVLVRILRLWITDELGYDFIPNKALMTRLNEEVKLRGTIGGNYERKLISLTSNYFICIHKDKVSLYKQKEITKSILEWDWKNQPEIEFNGYGFKVSVVYKKHIIDFKQHAKNTAYFDPIQMPKKLILKTWEKADKIIPFGSNKEVTISKIFKNEKIPREMREIIPVMLANNIIIWVPEVRRSTFANINEKTREVLVFTCLANP